MSSRVYDSDLNDDAWAWTAPLLAGRAIRRTTAHHLQARLSRGRLMCPSVVILDSQSVKTTERGGTRGFDGHKRARESKRSHGWRLQITRRRPHAFKVTGLTSIAQAHLCVAGQEPSPA